MRIGLAIGRGTIAVGMVLAAMVSTTGFSSPGTHRVAVVNAVDGVPRASSGGATENAPFACWECWPGGYGVPQICESNEHFDRNGTSSAYVQGTMHDGCAPNSSCPHDACEGSYLPFVDSLKTYVATGDTKAIERLLRTSEHFEFNDLRSAIQVIGCDKSVVFQAVLQEPERLALRAALLNASQ